MHDMGYVDVENTKKNPPSSFFGGWHFSIRPIWLSATIQNYLFNASI